MCSSKEDPEDLTLLNNKGDEDGTRGGNTPENTVMCITNGKEEGTKKVLPCGSRGH